jgi:hypothetical protein
VVNVLLEGTFTLASQRASGSPPALPCNLVSHLRWMLRRADYLGCLGIMPSTHPYTLHDRAIAAYGMYPFNSIEEDVRVGCFYHEGTQQRAVT